MWPLLILLALDSGATAKVQSEETDDEGVAEGAHRGVQALITLRAATAAVVYEACLQQLRSCRSNRLEDIGLAVTNDSCPGFRPSLESRPSIER